MNDRLRELVNGFAIDMARIQEVDGDLLARVERFAVDCAKFGSNEQKARESAQAIPCERAMGK